MGPRRWATGQGGDIERETTTTSARRERTASGREQGGAGWRGATCVTCPTGRHEFSIERTVLSNNLLKKTQMYVITVL